MNGSLGGGQDFLDGSNVDKRPVVTCAGELEVFSGFEENLTQALPQESCEWRRALGRPIKLVHIGANFSPFNPASLPKVSQWDLIRQPVFHIYWSECSDLDLYKSNVREDIEDWMKQLSTRDIQDWMIVVIENYDGKRTKQLLPRATVLDKVRADFGSKQGDRCISVINPGKTESKSADSWRGLVARIRHLLLVAYARAVSKLEDHVRQQRERRNELGWDFMKYFKLQEELAQVLEMLGLNDEALVQYDELDALFSQFVANGITSESVSWLSRFQKPLERWHGLQLGPVMLDKDPSLLELRTYLFAKQAQMLLLTDKVWEVASRCLPFLHTCTRELTVLDIVGPSGAVSCWLFLAAMAVLHTCDKYNQADHIEEYSLHTAALWEYASQKLKLLGELCGLLPGNSPTSEQLHIVVSLSAGMGDNPGQPNDPSPTDRLKEALCSQEAFNKLYLELAELAMGTYKHVGRLRMARLVGRDVAAFYMLLGETQKAAAFLSDLLRTFEQDGWLELAAQTQIELVECYKQSKDMKKLVMACAYISAAVDLDTLVRWTYFDEMRKYLDMLNDDIVVPFDNILKIGNVAIRNESVVMQGNNIEVDVVIESNFPREFVCTDLKVCLQSLSSKELKGLGGNVLSKNDMKYRDPILQKLKIKKTLDYKQDKQLASAGIVAKMTELKRKDSSPMKVNETCDIALETDSLPLVIAPGANHIRLKNNATNVGKYCLSHVNVCMKNFHLVSSPLRPRLTVEVKEEGPSLSLYKRAAPLLSGIEQVMNLILTVGSYKIEPKSKIKLTASPGLTFRTKSDEPLTHQLEVEVGDKPLFSSTKTPIMVMADMLTKDHQVTIHVPWSTSRPIVVPLTFTPPMGVTWRLYTEQHRKYVQVNVVGQCVKDLVVDDADLKVNKGDIDVVAKHVQSSQIIENGMTFSYIWELKIQPVSESPALLVKAEFAVKYCIGDETNDTKTFQYFFDIGDYQTLYILDAEVEPAKGNEFCRIGIVCHLHLTITYCGHTSVVNNNVKSVMYEVLAEQSVWAVCGRTAGVICFENESEPQKVVLDVMPLTSGHLPLPLIRISKYIHADLGITDKQNKGDAHPRLEPFGPGQVYNRSKGKQLYVIATATES